MLIIVNLNLMVTRNCNFRCAHCLRGESANESISDEVLEKIFQKGTVIQLLELNGGEVFSQPQILKKIIDTIIKNRVLISHVNIPTNGTLYSPIIAKELDRLNNYIIMCDILSGLRPNSINIEVDISKDPYHMSEIKRIEKSDPELYKKYMINMGALLSSKYFSGPRIYPKLIKTGRAKKLPEATTAPSSYPMYYFENHTPFGSILQVNTVGVDIKGTICNTCSEMPPKGLNIYGNILTEKLEDIIKRVGIRLANEQEFEIKYTAETQETLREIINSRQ